MNSDRTQNTTFEESLIDYYLLLKFRIHSKNMNLSLKQLRQNQEFLSTKESLWKTHSKTSIGFAQLLEYLKELVEIYSEMKSNLRESEFAIRKNEDSANFHQQNYENLIRKLESDLRNHMKAEFEMKLHIEYMEESFNNLKKENKLLNDKLKGHGDKLDINVLKNEIKNLKELSKQMQSENSRKEKELTDLIADLKKKIHDYEEIFKSLQSNKAGGGFTKNNFYYSVNNVNNGNLILNNLNTNNSNSGNIKMSDYENNNNNSTSNHDKFEKFNTNSSVNKYNNAMMHKRSSSSINNFMNSIDPASISPNINDRKTKLKLIQSNFLDSNLPRLEKMMNKNISNSKIKVRNNSKEHPNQGDTIVLNGDLNLKGPNLNIRKYMLNTFNKTKMIARNSSGIF